jgi:uncharacterized protein YhfF
MRVHEFTSQFGWPGDGGLGMRLIDAIRDGRKTATCCPLALCTPAEAAATRATAGRLVTVVDRFGAPHCTIRVVEVLETPWGLPDARLVRREGFTDVAAWRSAMAAAWRDALERDGVVLADDTPLLAELFELAADEDGAA